MRAARRTEQNRRLRRRTTLTAAVAIVVLLVVGTVLFVAGRGARQAAASVTGRTQHTLLLVVRGADGPALGSALLAHDSADHQGAVVLIPSPIVTEVPGRGSAMFGDAVTLGPTALPGETLADMANVVVDGVWSLDTGALARLVDSVGGVTVARVDKDVVTVLPGGARQVTVAAGSDEHLDGARAAAFATFLAPGETEADRLVRLQATLVAVLQALPASADRVTQTVAALGGGSSTTVPPATVAALLTGLAGDAAGQNVQYQELPVKPIQTGDETERYNVDDAKVAALVQQDFAGSLPPARFEGPNRVLVINGTGASGLGESARGRLDAHGLVFVGSSNESGFLHRDQHTDIVIPDDSARSVAAGQRVAGSLRLPASDVSVSAQLDVTIADVVVVLGADYKP